MAVGTRRTETVDSMVMGARMGAAAGAFVKGASVCIRLRHRDLAAYVGRGRAARRLRRFARGDRAVDGLEQGADGAQHLVGPAGERAGKIALGGRLSRIRSLTSRRGDAAGIGRARPRDRA